MLAEGGPTLLGLKLAGEWMDRLDRVSRSVIALRVEDQVVAVTRGQVATLTRVLDRVLCDQRVSIEGPPREIIRSTSVSHMARNSSTSGMNPAGADRWRRFTVTTPASLGQLDDGGRKDLHRSISSGCVLSRIEDTRLSGPMNDDARWHVVRRGQDDGDRVRVGDLA
jgi:hypothetical protein